MKLRKVTALTLAAAMTLSLAACGNQGSTPAASGTDALADVEDTVSEPDPVRIDGGVDIEAYNGKVENEYAQPLNGSFSSNAVNLEVPDKDGDEDISVMEWDGTKQWANGRHTSVRQEHMM